MDKIEQATKNFELFGFKDIKYSPYIPGISKEEIMELTGIDLDNPPSESNRYKAVCIAHQLARDKKENVKAVKSFKCKLYAHQKGEKDLIIISTDFYPSRNKNYAIFLDQGPTIDFRGVSVGAMGFGSEEGIDPEKSKRDFARKDKLERLVISHFEEVRDDFGISKDVNFKPSNLRKLLSNIRPSLYIQGNNFPEMYNNFIFALEKIYDQQFKLD